MRSLIGCQALKWLLFHVISCDVHMIVFQILLLVKIFKFILKLKELSPFLSSAQNDKVLFGFIFIQSDNNNNNKYLFTHKSIIFKNAVIDFKWVLTT